MRSSWERAGSFVVKGLRNGRARLYSVCYLVGSHPPAHTMDTQRLQQRGAHTHFCVHRVTLAQTHLPCIQMFPCLFVLFKPRLSELEGNFKTLWFNYPPHTITPQKWHKNKNQLPCPAGSTVLRETATPRSRGPSVPTADADRFCMKSWGLSELTRTFPLPRLWSLQATIHCGEGVSLRTTGWCLAVCYRIFTLVIKWQWNASSPLRLGPHYLSRFPFTWTTKLVVSNCASLWTVRGASRNSHLTKSSSLGWHFLTYTPSKKSQS